MVTAGVRTCIYQLYFPLESEIIFQHKRHGVSHCVTHSGGKRKHRQDAQNIKIMSEINLFEASSVSNVEIFFCYKELLFCHQIVNSTSDDEQSHSIFNFFQKFSLIHVNNYVRE